MAEFGDTAKASAGLRADIRYCIRITDATKRTCGTRSRFSVVLGGVKPNRLSPQMSARWLGTLHSGDGGEKVCRTPAVAESDLLVLSHPSQDSDPAATDVCPPGHLHRPWTTHRSDTFGYSQAV